jgi:hypothetical protein
MVIENKQTNGGNQMPYDKISVIREMLANGVYDMEEAVAHTADVIIQYPETLLWR